MKNLLLVLVFALIAFSSCTSKSAVESKKRQAQREAKAQQRTEISSVTYVLPFEIKVKRIESAEMVILFDSTVTHIQTGKVQHRTLLRNFIAKK